MRFQCARNNAISNEGHEDPNIIYATTHALEQIKLKVWQYQALLGTLSIWDSIHILLYECKMAQILQKKVQLFINLNICLSYMLVINFLLPNLKFILQNLLCSDGQGQAWSVEGTRETLQAQGAPGFRSAVSLCLFLPHNPSTVFSAICPSSMPTTCKPLSNSQGQITTLPWPS